MTARNLKIMRAAIYSMNPSALGLRSNPRTINNKRVKTFMKEGIFKQNSCIETKY